MGFSICLEGGHEGRIREVQQEDRRSSTLCTLTIMHCRLVSVRIHNYDLPVLLSSTRLSIFAIPACAELDS
jgi:hypothetical protein